MGNLKITFSSIIGIYNEKTVTNKTVFIKKGKLLCLKRETKNETKKEDQLCLETQTKKEEQLCLKTQIQKI